MDFCGVFVFVCGVLCLAFAFFLFFLLSTRNRHSENIQCSRKIAYIKFLSTEWFLASLMGESSK